MNHWLFKTEPGCFSIDDLAAAPEATTSWDGVRNYQARNFMRDRMRSGDLGLLHHSGKNPGLVGVVEIVRESYPDHTAMDENGQHFDPRHSHDHPVWYMVDVRLSRTFDAPLPLTLLRTVPELAGMELLKKGSRLSVQPVRPEEFEAVMALADRLQGAGS